MAQPKAANTDSTPPPLNVQPPAGNVLEMIGNTPMIEARGFDTGPCKLFLKLENQNPGGSIKDRIGLSMINAAERSGKIKPGGTLIEATAGNTGLGLALVAAQKGYRLIIVLPDKMSQEKVFHLRALGAQVVMTRSDVGKGHPEYYQDYAERIASETENSFYVNQFGNAANVEAHYTTTGPEIWEQMAGDVDAVVCGVGSGGTITGLGRFFEEKSPKTEMILADPEGSVLADYVNTGKMAEEVGSWLVEGIGEDFMPPIAELDRVKKAYLVSDKLAFLTARELLAKEGILAGSSTGTLITAALKYCREQSEEKRVVTFVCDSGNKYLSKMYNDYWMIDQGFLERESQGDLRDLIARRHGDRATVTLGPDEPISTALTRMKLYDVSQIPVLDGDKVVGLIDESDILLAIYENEGRFLDPVKTAMSERLQTVSPNRPLEALLPIFARDMVAIVKDGEKFLGLITRMDLLNYLRRRRAEG